MPACFVLSACDELLLAPGWLFANGNVPQRLLLISQSCWVPLGAVTRRGKVPFPSDWVGLALGRSSVPIPSLSLLPGSPLLHLQLCCILILSSATFFSLPSSAHCVAQLYTSGSLGGLVLWAVGRVVSGCADGEFGSQSVIWEVTLCSNTPVLTHAFSSLISVSSLTF